MIYPQEDLSHQGEFCVNVQKAWVGFNESIQANDLARAGQLLEELYDYHNEDPADNITNMLLNIGLSIWCLASHQVDEATQYLEKAKGLVSEDAVGMFAPAFAQMKTDIENVVSPPQVVN